MTKHITMLCPVLMLLALGCSSTKSSNNLILTANNTKLYGFKFDPNMSGGEYFYAINEPCGPDNNMVYTQLNNVENLFRTNIPSPRLNIYMKIQRPGGPLVKVCGPISAVGRDEWWYFDVPNWRPTWCALDAEFTADDQAFLGKVFVCILWLKVGHGDFILYNFGPSAFCYEQGGFLSNNYAACAGFQFVWECASLVNGKSIYFELEPCIDDPGRAQCPKVSKRWQGPSGFYSEGDFPDLQLLYSEIIESLETDTNIPVAPTPERTEERGGLGGLGSLRQGKHRQRGKHERVNTSE